VDDYLQVLVSIDSEDRAHALQRLILEQRAAACVQILCPISSAYRWRGKIEEAQQWLYLAKTRRSTYPRLESLVKENHSYDTPEIIAIPTFAGYAGYPDWVVAETGA
jgi:periplasmic divalent cation tolerance protein